MKMTNLVKRFPGFNLRIDSLCMASGQIHGFIGPNGSGKTTAMKLMAGLLQPDAGEIDCEGLAPRDMTMVPRKPYFLHDSVYNNLIYPLTLRGIRPDEGSVEHHLELAGLKAERKKFAPSLSSGEQQKLALVRALIFSPKLIFIDEAFSNLDMESASLFERLILERQQKQPVTWVVISHQLAHIQRLCGQVCFMDAGRVEAQGSATEILLHPENPKLRRYLQHEALGGAR